MPDYLKALRDCCRDEAAFERLKKILRLATKDEIFYQQIESPDSHLSTYVLSLEEPNPNESDSSQAIARITGYEETVIGDRLVEINAWVDSLEKVRMAELFQESGTVHNLQYEFHKKSGEILVGLLSAEITNFNSQQYELTVTNNITERKGIKVAFPAAKLKCASPHFPHKAVCSAHLLGEMALRIRNSLNLEQILHSTVREVREFLQADRVFIGCLNEDNQGEIVAESVLSNCKSIKKFTLNQNYIQQIKLLYQKQNARAIEDTYIENVENSTFLQEYYQNYQVRASLGVPIMVDEQIFGVLVANQCASPRRWQKYEIDLLEKLAAQVAIAIQQAQLYKQVKILNSNLENQVKERTAQLEKRNRELQETNRIKDVLLHTVSHDLRTSVIGTLMVFKNWLKQSGETISVPRSTLDRMVTASDRQLSMINSLLETHANEGQSIIIHRELVQFNKLIDSIIKDLEPTLTENQATLTNFVSNELPLVMADPTQIQRVFDTLFTNILKHNPPGLSLTLNAEVQAGVLRCTLKDNGVGMSQVECDRLFDLYIRDPQARCSTGIGLKLYLCRQIMKAHGGEIGVNSRPRSGTSFWFTLPLAD